MTLQIQDLKGWLNFIGLIFYRKNLKNGIKHVINNDNVLQLKPTASRVKVHQLNESTISIDVSGSNVNQVLNGATEITASLKRKWRPYMLLNGRLSRDGTSVLFTFENTSTNYRIKHDDYKTLARKGKLKLDKRVGNVWNFDQTPHVIISGATGSGKSQALDAYLRSLTMLKARFKFVDPKHAELSKLGAELHVPVARDFDEAIQVLTEVHREMGRRQNSEKHYVPLFLVIEEMGALNALAPTNKDKQAYLSLLKRILVMSRSANIHVISVMQTATADNIGGIEIRAQYGVKILLGSPQQEELQFLMPAGTPAIAFGKFAGYVYIEGNGINHIQTPSRYMD